MAAKKKEAPVVTVKPDPFYKKWYNNLVSVLGVVFDNLNWLIGKLFKPFLYTLEGIGIYYVLHMTVRYDVGLAMIKAGQIEAGRAYIDALIAMANATNSIVLAIAVALPTFIGAMKIAKRRLIQ
jgi:hypothetical protein